MDFLIFLFERFVEKFIGLYSQNWQEILFSITILTVIFTVLMLIEVVKSGYEDSTLRRLFRLERNIINDLISFLVTNSSLMVFLAAIMSLGSTHLMAKGIRDFFSFDLSLYLPDFLHFMVFFVVLDFFNYWVHRLMHEIPYLWHIHKYHHSAVEMNFVTVSRDHPVERAIGVLATALAIGLTGVPSENYVLFSLLFSTYGFLKHSSFNLSWGWFGKYVFQSPKDHWIHHSTLKEHCDKNYANNFAVWDHIFGTYYQGDVINKKIGLPNEDFSKHNIFQLIWCFYWDFLMSVYFLISRKIMAVFNKVKV